jgi:alpha-L-fucosidase
MKTPGRRAARLTILALALAVPAATRAEEAYQPTPANLASRSWFRDARLGLFVHWGVYSTLADGEWVMNQRHIKVSEYEKLPAFFNPQAYDPVEWVAMAKAAGMKYITITSKHHDGFAMFDSKISDYNIVARTPYKKDVLKMLADECHKQGIKLFFYHSQLDWHHPDYFPRGRVGLETGRPDSGDWNRYMDYMDGQLKELLTGYGDVAGIWFDGMWDKPNAEWRLAKTYKLIHDLQPAALVGSNHHLKPFPGEDFQMFEKDLPGHNTTGFNDKVEIGDLPREMCETMNDSWGFNLLDTRYKSTKDVVHLLVKAAGYDANLLLNVGPMPNGKIQPEFVARLKEVGAWTARYGESIYCTRGGPIPARNWGVTTRKGDRIYVHVLDWPDAPLALPKLEKAVRAASYLKDGSKAVFKDLGDSVVLTLADGARDPIDTIVALDLAAR